MTDPKNPATMNEKQMAVENIKAMFRLTMLENARNPGESLEQLRERIAKDPGTFKVAQMLNTTVEDLMKGFGETQNFFTPEGYNHQQASAEVSKIIEEVANQRPEVWGGGLGSDGKGKSGTQHGVLTAPKEGERKAAILTADQQTANLLRQNLQAARGVSSTRMPTLGKDDPSLMPLPTTRSRPGDKTKK